MVKILINGVERYYDGYTIEHLDLLKKLVDKKWDGVILYGGYEGDGKSTKCSQDLAYLDPTFDLSRVCFNLKQLTKLMEELPPYSAIQYDESWKDTSNMGRFQQSQRKLIKLLTEKRKKRFFIGIVSATFFDLNKYFVIHRTRAYIHIHAQGLERGFFKFYNRELKQDLYIRGKRDWNINVVKPLFYGRFTDWMPFDSEEYEKAKDAGTKADQDEPEQALYDMSAFRDGQDDVLLYLRDVVELFKRGESRGLFTRIAEHLNMDPSSLTRRVTKYRLKKQHMLDNPRNKHSDTLIPGYYELNTKGGGEE